MAYAKLSFGHENGDHNDRHQCLSCCMLRLVFDVRPAELNQQLDSTPFTHLASHIRRGSQYTSHFRLIIHGPLNAKNGTILRSIYGCVPRALPPSCTRHVSRLILEDIQFRFLADLLRISGELHALRSFHGVRLTWSSDHEEAPATPAWRGRGYLPETMLTDCTPHHPCHSTSEWQRSSL